MFVEEERQDSPLLNDVTTTDQMPCFSRRLGSSALVRAHNLSILEIYEIWISFKVIQGGEEMGGARDETELDLS